MIKKILSKLLELRKYNKKVFSSSKADDIAVIKNKLTDNQISYIIDNIKVTPEAAPLFIVKVKSEDLAIAKSLARNIRQ
jgi:hypothetical protein